MNWLLLLISGLVSCAVKQPPPPSFEPAVRLHNAAEPGMEMPIMGLGTGGYGNAGGGGEWWNDTVAEKAVGEWLKQGGRRLDTSLLYFTQKGVGAGWKKSGIDRKEIFITSKCDVPGMSHNGSGSGGMFPGGYDITMNSIKTSLEQLQTDYIDLMMIHWPGTPSAPKEEERPSCWSAPNNWKACRVATWHALEDAFKAKKLRAIGVSNFELNHLQDILDLKGLIPAVNQYEYHPYWQSAEMLAQLEKLKIVTNSYSPVGCPDHMATKPDVMPVLLVNNKVIKSIAEQHKKSPAQVLIRWGIQKRFVLNPRTLNPDHMRENMDVFDFKLSSNDMKQIDALKNGQHVCGDPHDIP